MEFLQEYGYLGLFVTAFLSATVLPVASEGFLALMIYQGLNPTITVFAATAGNLLGGLTSYFLGYLARWELIEKYFGISQATVSKHKPRMDRYGSFLAVLSIFPIIGDILVIGLGFFRVSVVKVGFWMLLSKFVRYALIAWLLLNSK